jgi:hypothetical protein
MTSAFKTMAVSMWDLLGSVLVAEQKSVQLDAQIKDGCASEVHVYFFPEGHSQNVGPEDDPPGVGPDAVLVLSAERVELLDPRQTDRSRISGWVQYEDPAFYRVLVKFLGKCGIKVQSSRIAQLFEALPDPPLVAARARYLIDRVLEQFPMWLYIYQEVLAPGHDLYARATLEPDEMTHYSVSFSPEKIEGYIPPGDFSLPGSEFAVDCADPDFRKQFAAILADSRLQQIDLSGLP